MSEQAYAQPTPVAAPQMATPPPIGYQGGYGYDYGYGGEPPQSDPHWDLNIARVLQIVRRRFGLFLFVLASITLLGIVLALLIPDRYKSEASILVLSEPSNIVDIESVVTGVSNDQVGILSEIELIKSIEVLNRVVSGIGEDGQLGLLGQDLKTRSIGNRFSQLYDKTLGVFGLDLEEVALPGIDLGSVTASAADPNPVQVAQSTSSVDWLHRVQVDDEIVAEVREGNLEDDTATLLRQNLSVGQVGRSRVISVDFTYVDPVIAADIANRFADSYIAAQVQAKFDATQKANLLLNEQLTTLRAQIAELEGEIEDYRSQNGLINRDAAIVAGQRVEQLSQALIQSKAQLANIQARKSEAESIRQGDRTLSLENTAEVLGSPLIGDLRIREIAVEQELSLRQRELAANHPTLVSLRDELGTVRSRIASEVSKIVRSIEADENALRAELDVLQENLDEADLEVARLNKAERELDALNMEVEANRNLLEVFLARAKETDVQEEFQQPDAQVISAANVSNDPSSPNRQIYFLLSLLAGIGCALGSVVYFELTDPTVNDIRTVRELTRMPIYGMLP
ncbi:MAG: GumC family protein, partial [Pseudomonadota bacterium]